MSSATSGRDEPVIFRPVRLLRWTAGFSSLLVISSAGVWIGLGAEVRADFTGLQIITLLIFVAFMVGLMLSLGLSYGRAESGGFTWRNGLRTHHADWSSIRGLVFRSGDPWAYLLVDPREDKPSGGEPQRLAVMAIQSTDRAAAQDKADRLRGLMAQYRKAQ